MTAVVTLDPVTLPELPNDECLDENYEEIDGQRVELPPMSAYASRLAFRLASKLNRYAEQQDLGEVTTDTLFDLGLPRNRKRKPDVGYVSYQRWPKGQPSREDDNAWAVVPNLAVEVVSPTDFAQYLLTKLAEYFQAGVQLVWVIYPSQRLVYVYQSLTQVHGLTRADTLDGGTVLPGFQLPLRELFLEEPAAS